MGAIIVLLVYGVLGAVVLGGIALLYFRSVLSRRVYRCPRCHEIVRVELMRARFCNFCGAPLHGGEEDDDAPA